jgi:DNA polymerase-2
VDFSLVYCPTRKAMIESLNHWFERNDPDVVIGWNVIQFDLRVLQKTADECGVQFLLGRERRPIEWRTHPGKQGYLFAPTPGRVLIDGIDALKAAVWSFPSFSLETVSQTLLGEGKSIGDEYDKMAEIERRYQHDKPALALYNIRDCELVLRIFEKAKLLQFMMERAHATGLQADHFGGSIAAFSHHYLPRMHRLGYVAPSVGEIASKAYPGGYVMDSRPGFYDSVVVLDYKSLYPSIIRTFLVDPVGFVEGSNAKDAALLVKGPEGTVFSRDMHCLPEIVTTLWRARDEAKRVKNEPLSQALKLLMNSFAGVLGASECRFFNPKLVSAITLRGHEMMKLTRDFVEQRGYEAIYGDTDSIFIWLRRTHTNEEAHAVAADLVRDINAWWTRTLREEQGLQNLLEIEFDTHYSKFFMPTIRGSDVGSKKRYAGLSTDAAGKEEMVYRGLEMARSDWTPLARQFQQGLLSRIFHGEPYKAFVTDYARGDAGRHQGRPARLPQAPAPPPGCLPGQRAAAGARRAHRRRIQRQRRAAHAVPERRLDPVRHDPQRARAAGGAPLAHRLRALPGQAAAADCRRHPAADGRELHGADDVAARSFLRHGFACCENGAWCARRALAASVHLIASTRRAKPLLRVFPILSTCRSAAARSTRR